MNKRRSARIGVRGVPIAFLVCASACFPELGEYTSIQDGAGGDGGVMSTVTSSTTDTTTVGGGGAGGAPPGGPCGPVPQSGLFVCWSYGFEVVPPGEYVGLAGGSADPDLGETIQNEFNDPMCGNPIPGQPFVQCDLGAPASNWDIQFRASRHVAPGAGTIAGTWDCSTTTCYGDVFIYDDGVEIGSLIADVPSGVVSTIAHFNPPGLLNVKVAPP